MKTKEKATTSIRLLLGCVVIVADIMILCNGQTYTYRSNSLWWHAAEYYCNCTGHLVVLDTEAKQTVLLNAINITAGDCAWIGASTSNSNRQYRWIEPHQGSGANGELLSNTYSNFADFPESTSELRGVCITSDGTWRDEAHNTKRPYVCEWNACGPGYYKGRESTTIPYCGGQRDACLPCPGETIKPNTGDSSSCTEDCGGGSKVANTEHTACECNAGYYGSSSTTCTLCPGNTIKSARGDAPDCNVETPCDGVSSEVNADHTACVCKAGYYKSGSSCTLCTGNEIKSTPGDAADCSADTPCDGATNIPNSDHTACVCNAGYYRNGTDCMMCTGNTIKTTVGNTDTCDEACNGVKIVPNADHTACVCVAGYNMLVDGSCSKLRKSEQFNLKERNMGVISDEGITLQAGSKLECGGECVKRSCFGFAFYQQQPGVRMCNMTMTESVTLWPLEGAEYYVKPRRLP